MELAVILCPIFVFVIARMALEHRSRARADNVRLLEEALKSPTVDRATLESLTYQLTGHRPPHKPGTSRFMAFLLAIGWLGLFTGLGLWLAGEMTRCNELTIAGMITSIIGFGFVTYPFALRELEARRQAQ
jgi:hypothetical protein